MSPTRNLIGSIGPRAVLISALLYCSASAAQVAAPTTLSDTEHDGDLADADRDAQARTRFFEGKKAYDTGDFRTAWQHFREAYVLSHRPQLLFNIGQAADRLGETADAESAFKMYLEQLPDADNALQVRARMEELRKNQEQSLADAAERTVRNASSSAPPSPQGHLDPTKGWMMQAGVGVGLYAARWSDDGSAHGLVRGGGFAVDGSVALTVLPGFLVGGIAMLNYQPAPIFTEGDAPSQDMEGQTLWGLGPTALFYLNSDHYGPHLQGSLVLSGVNRAKQPGTVGSASATANATGVGLILGGGYDLALDDTVRYGVSGRAGLLTLAGDDLSLSALTLAICGTLTWY